MAIREKRKVSKGCKVKYRRVDRILTANKAEREREKDKWSRLGISNCLSKGSLKW